jgi:hypothetical protein
MSSNNKTQTMTVNKRHILHAAWLRLTLCVAALAVLCVLVSCSDDSDDDGSRTVVLRFSTAQAAGVTRAATASTAKDDAVKDLTVLIFDSNGDVIGSNYGSYTIESSTSFSVSIKTRVAKGCTVYAFANVGTLVDPSYFYGLATKAAVDSKVYTLKDNNELNTSNCNCLLMKGELTDFDTSTSAKTTVSLERLASKFDITITAKNDATNGTWPVTIDKYQFFNVPSTTSLAKASSTVPLSYHSDASATVVSNKTSSSSADATVSIPTYYMFGNPVGKNPAATKWTLRNASNLPSGRTCTYIRIWAHTAVWKSYFDVYLGGTTLIADGTSPTYDYTDYTIYPNYHYTVNITIKGSGHAENGARVTYQAIPYFSVASINAWDTDTTTPIDM